VGGSGVHKCQVGKEGYRGPCFLQKCPKPDRGEGKKRNCGVLALCFYGDLKEGGGNKNTGDMGAVRGEAFIPSVEDGQKWLVMVERTMEKIRRTEKPGEPGERSLLKIKLSKGGGRQSKWRPVTSIIV